VRPLVTLLWNALRLLLLPGWLVGRALGRHRGGWLVVRVRPRVVELARPAPRLARYLPWLWPDPPTPLEALRRLASHVARDARVDGVLFVLPPLASGWSAADGLRRVVDGLRRAGRPTAVYLPQGGGHKEMFVASAADRVLLAPTATLSLLGLAAEQPYLGTALSRLGVAVEVHARAEYKTAAENLARDAMSDAQREQVTALLASIDGALRRALADRPRLGEAGVDAVFERGMFSGRDAVDAGLVDALAYEDELPLALRADDAARPVRIRPALAYYRWHEARLLRPLRPRPTVAVIPVHGAIGVGAPPGPLSGGGAGLAPLVAAVRRARRDPSVAGVVLHVDSPGGSALVSDLVHREVERLAERKPVVACFGNVAASGGYYVAAPAHAIVASPLSITGSIGVVSARLVLRGLLDRLGVRTEVIRTAPHADMLSPTRALAPEEHAILEREIDGYYRTFVGVVARGRRRPFEEVEPLARGRVWSGADAHARGLVDRLGGLDAALDEVRGRLPRAIAARVEPALVIPEGEPGEPPEPRTPPGPAPAGPATTAAAVAAQALGALGSRLSEWSPALAELGPLLRLVARGERVIYLATGLPRID
jgi:protease-4